MNRSEWDPRFRRPPPAQPPGWVDPPQYVAPPVRPEPPLIDDGYYVEPTSTGPLTLAPRRRRPYQGWDAGRPMPSWFAWWGLGVCVGIIIMALLITVRTAIDGPAPRSAPVIPSAGTSATPNAATPSAVGQGPIGAPGPTGGIGTALIGGWATWYDDARRDGRYAAAGPLIRQALGDWRGKTIRITAGDRETIVQLVDFCACGDRRGIPTIVDLSPRAFADVAPLSDDPDERRRQLEALERGENPRSLLGAGVIRVEMELVDARATLPPTDVPDQHPEDPPEHPDDDRMRDEVRGDELYR